MQITAEELTGNLLRLRANLITCRPFVPDASREDIAKNAAEKMPLSHTTTEAKTKLILIQGALQSAQSRGVPTPRNCDRSLEGENEICFYLGSAAFPNNEVGFLFSHELTEMYRGNSTATPFDSGGCISKYTLPPGIAPLTHVREHKMPVPECRSYLGDLLASHFTSAEAYLAGELFRCPVSGTLLPDPHGMTDYELGLVRTHEVRIPGEVALCQPYLIAVFTRRGSSPPALAKLRAAGVKIVPYSASPGPNRTKALRQASIEFIVSQVLN